MSKSWPENEYTPLEDIPSIIASTKATFRTGLTLPHAYRQAQLYALARLVQDNAEIFADALHADLGRPKVEAYMAELGPLVKRSLVAAERLKEWMAEEDVSEKVEVWQRGWKPRIRREPRGVGLIVAPWNYPLILSLQPLMGAISAGCCAVLKLSEVSPHTSSLLAKLLPRYLDERAYRVVLGGVKEVGRVLEEKFDHIFYTGNSTIARIISLSASKHLTPLTLELGGKSPVLIDPSYDLELAIKRVVWGKCNNAGQICIAPDYILLPHSSESVVEEFVRHFEKVVKDADYSSIVSKTHFDRLLGLLKGTKGKILSGGQVDVERMRMEPTLVVVGRGMFCCRGMELFGPILPVVLVKDIDEGIEFIRNRDHPLVLYAFTEDEELKETILRRTMSGTVSFNDTFGQLLGYGRQVLKATFDAFTYERGISDVPKSYVFLFSVIGQIEFFKAGVVGAKIPADGANGHGGGIATDSEGEEQDTKAGVEVKVDEVSY
ncbi:aldehyde dehydrogenase [Cyathus striatus]|nr:aldehyde dehydrogenase [Cyathus striatus]